MWDTETVPLSMLSLHCSSTTSYMSRIPLKFTVDKLVRTWSPRFEPFVDEGQWPPYTGPVYIADLSCRWDKRWSRKRSRHGMAMDQVSRRTKRGRMRPFVEEPEQNLCSRCGRLGHNSRTCFWPPSQVQINRIYKFLQLLLYYFVELIDILLLVFNDLSW